MALGEVKYKYKYKNETGPKCVYYEKKYNWTWSECLAGVKLIQLEYQLNLMKTKKFLKDLINNMWKSRNGYFHTCLINDYFDTF